MPHAMRTPLPALTQADLLRFEQEIKDALAPFIPFTGFSLYFPGAATAKWHEDFGEGFATAVALPKERRLLVPLRREGELLGVFVATRLRRAVPKALLPLLPVVADLVLDKLALRVAAGLDPLSLSVAPHALAGHIAGEIEAVQSRILPGAFDSAEVAGGCVSGCFGVLAFEVDGLDRLRAEQGFVFSRTVLRAARDKAAEILGTEAVIARLDGREGLSFAALVPGFCPSECAETALKLASAMEDVRLDLPLSSRVVRLSSSVGYANYPQDMRGAQLSQNVEEQTASILQKAVKALATAMESGPGTCLGYAEILSRGGSVLSVLPLSRLVVSLGKSVDAREGQRFVIWATAAQDASGVSKRLAGDLPALPKGECILMETREDASVAEVIALSDPSWRIEPGDRLFLAPDGDASGGHAGRSAESRDARSGVLGHAAFAQALPQAMEKSKIFCLAVLRVLSVKGVTAMTPSEIETALSHTADTVLEVAGPHSLAGRYSTSQLTVFAPEREAPELAQALTDALAGLEHSRGIRAALGVAGWPFLHFARTDVLDNGKKALEHALVVPEGPRTALFDSVSLTISADRLFADGDLYAAVEEYKLALLADPDNTLARNSLGICLARLGRFAQAKTEFKEVIAKDGKNLMAHYNLGNVLVKLGESEDARKAYQRCLKLNPADAYSLLRLGKLAEDQGRLAHAATYYNRAAALPGGSDLTRRHQARLALKRGRAEEARTLLHQAISLDPKDAFSIHLMAKLYLDAGDDPAMAEALARQAVALRPDQKHFWKELARALSAQGREEEAAAALDKANS